jgi:predicted transcriptional regulator
MARGPVRPPLLGELESSVMDFLWDGGEGEAKAVHRGLGASRGITLNTIQSTLKRLFEKGLLARDKVSHAHVYRPSMTRDEFQRGALDKLVGALMGGEAAAMLSAFVDLTERAGPKHLERLEKLVAERRRALRTAQRGKR